jgi:hypothetical protein
VFLVAGLLFVGFWICFAVVMILMEGDLPFQDVYFWIANAGVLSGAASYMLLLYFVAAGQLSFASENRSTKVRAAMLVQHALWTGWMCWCAAEFPTEAGEIAITFLVIIGIHWYVMGTLLSGESPELSPRVKRGLPQSFLGRAFLTWFNPGPGTGYVFVLSNLAAAFVLAWIGLVGWMTFNPTNVSTWWGSKVGDIAAFSVLLFSYIAAYLGVGRLLVWLLRKVIYVGIPLAFLLQLLLLAVGSLLPLTIHLMIPTIRNEYSLVEISSPFYTLIWLMGWGMDDMELLVLLLLVPVGAGLVLLANLPGVATEVRQVRVAKPKRVIQEDTALAAAARPQAPVKQSPWD